MKPYYEHAGITIYHGDCREVLPHLVGTYETIVTDPVWPNASPLLRGYEKWLRKSEQGDKWNRCLIEGMIVLSETGARDEQTTPP